MTDPVVSFYAGGRDSQGRTLAEILAWGDDELEAVHDYIQWMFPTSRPSGVNPDAQQLGPSPETRHCASGCARPSRECSRFTA